MKRQEIWLFAELHDGKPVQVYYELLSKPNSLQIKWEILMYVQLFWMLKKIVQI